MPKKEIAISFLKLAASGEVQSAYDKFVAPTFIHHNQYFKGDRESLMRAMQEAHERSPNKSFEVKQVFEDGDHVITHSLVQRNNPDALPIAVVHIFKIHNTRIVELWDLGQEVLRDSPNQYGMF